MLLKRFNLVSFIVIFIFLIVNKCIPSEDLEERKVLNEELSTISKLLDIGQSSKALDLIEKVTLEYGFSESLNISRGRALVQLGEKAKGESIFREILSQNPHSIDANLYIAKLYSLEKNWDQSDKYISIVLNKDPKNSKALILLGSVILQRDGNVAAARSLIERAARYAPSDPQIQYELGVVRFYDNSPDEAKNAFEKGEELNPDLDPALIGKVYAHYKRLDWAVKQFEKAVEKRRKNRQNPESSLLVLLAESKEAIGEKEEALAIFREVVLNEPYHAIAQAGIGLILLGTLNSNLAATHACGLNQQEALAHLEMALQLQPSLKIAENAIRFCQMEIGEAKMWRGIISDSVASNQKPLKTSSPSPISPSSSLIKMMISPFRTLSSFLNQLHTKITHSLCSILKSMFPLLSGKICRNYSSRSEPENRLFQERLQIWDYRNRTLASVPRIDIQTREDFNMILQRHEPVIITGLQTQWKQTGNFDFSVGALRERFGTSLVRVSVSETERFDGPESGVLWGLDKSVDVLVRPPQTSMLFSDFLTLIDRNQKTKGDYKKVIPMTETFYLEYLALHQYLGKAFLELIPLPDYITNSSLKHLLTNVWIGGKLTTSPLHYDDYENLLCQIRGTKEVLLFPPDDYPNLYYQGRPKGTLKYEYPGQFIRDTSSIDKRSYVFGSSVNVDHPNFNLHPLFRKVKPIRALLKPGDTLYLPAFWHHEVQSIPDDQMEEALNIAVNFWFSNLTVPPDHM